jgi:hypothetical protein
MKKNNPGFLFLTVLFLFAVNLVSGHSPENPATTDGNLYLHTNLTGYHPGESILFKAYLLNEKHTQSSDSIYTALLDKDGKEVAGNTLPVMNYRAYGKIDIPSSAGEGFYVLIASVGTPNNAVPSEMFSRILEIRSNEEPELTAEVKLTEPLYKPGSALTSNIRLSGIEGKPVQSSFSWELTGSSGQISAGKGKTEANGKGSFTMTLPDFKKDENLQLTVTASNKGPKKITSIIIPTTYNTVINQGEKPDAANDKLNISIKTLKQQYLLDELVEAEIIVADENGNKVPANLSVACSNLTGEFSQVSDVDFPSFRTIENKLITLPATPEERKPVGKVNPAGNGKPSANSKFTEIVRHSFSQYLLLATHQPGKPFDASTSKSSKGKRPPKQEGYSPDLSVLDIIMQIKPYSIASNKIMFSSSGITSINFQDGALIVIDGVMSGTDISVLRTISTPDIALITASTRPMDIMKYTALNSTGVIEISLKKGSAAGASKDSAANKLSDSLLWQSDLSTDDSGKTKISFRGNKSSEVAISVAGMTSEGIAGHKTIHVIFN